MDKIIDRFFEIRKALEAEPDKRMRYQADRQVWLWCAAILTAAELLSGVLKPKPGRS